MATHSAKNNVPAIRITAANRRYPNADGRFVLYWMTANRRTAWNHALDRGVEWAERLGKPLLITETLCCKRRWSSRRHHAFALQGMADNAATCKRFGFRYYPFVQRQGDDLTALITSLAAHSCLIVTDDYPLREHNAEIDKVAAKAKVLIEKVDANGLLPLAAAERVFPTAYAFRRFLQRVLPDHLLDVPRARPLARLALPRNCAIPLAIIRRWPPASARLLTADADVLRDLPIDHAVPQVATCGGPQAANRRLQTFLTRKLADYATARSHPDLDLSSRLSPYLHFGHISVHEIFHRLARQEGWSPDDLCETATGKREGYWGMSPSAEAFLDELVTWREIGFNMSAQTDNYDAYDSLPEWAKSTLAKHARDHRQHVYELGEFERAATHDRLWNAAQRQLLCEGTIHNYMRMLWGKKILHWSESPRAALATMIELNNKYALDGQDPNSYSGIFWVLGRYDRVWGPERKIFGKVRYMSSHNTARKLKLGNYLDKFDKGNYTAFNSKS